MSYKYKVVDVWQCNAQGLEHRLNEFCEDGLEFEFVVDRFVVFSKSDLTDEEQAALAVAVRIVGIDSLCECGLEKGHDLASEDERSSDTPE